SNEERSFSEADIEKLRNYCLADKSNPHAPVMLVAMETGMRVGELTALKKEDIHDGYIYVHRQQVFVPKTDLNEISYYKDVNYTKNEREHPKGGRMIPITKNCQMALDIAENLPGESEYVFHHPNGKPILKQSYMYYLRRRCKTLGIEISNNHAFRVAFNARLIEAGVDGNERCFVLGHSMQTNERHYSFSDRRKADDVRDKLKRLETQ
ncbi:MAG: tyrosine-type recombinase/integrase, partial [Saccharofermentans sp.]|nr:tyrosine-type recombinase/integrase [Saccharofermentans sp.]